VCQSHTGRLTGFWFLPNRPKGWTLMNEWITGIGQISVNGFCLCGAETSDLNNSVESGCLSSWTLQRSSVSQCTRSQSAGDISVCWGACTKRFSSFGCWSRSTESHWDESQSITILGLPNISHYIVTPVINKCEFHCEVTWVMHFHLRFQFQWTYVLWPTQKFLLSLNF
jgi:hypothetical protein